MTPNSPRNKLGESHVRNVQDNDGVTTTTKRNAKTVAAAILNAILFVLLDRVQLLAWPHSNGLPDIPGFSIERDTFVHKQTSIQTYRRVRTLRNLKTETAIFLQYGPVAPWLAPLKITIITQARQGLSRADLLSIAGAFKRVHLLLVEFAIDFAPDSHVGRSFIMLHALFGRSEPQTVKQHATIRFGTRRSDILARAYRRNDDSFRTELEAHSGWLRHNHFSKIEDLAQLPTLLLPDHLSFFSMDWQRLRAHLARKDESSADRIVAHCQGRATSLHGLLKYIREDVGLTNVRRFLRRLPLNQQIEAAALAWARRWREASENSDDVEL